MRRAAAPGVTVTIRPTATVAYVVGHTETHERAGTYTRSYGHEQLEEFSRTCPPIIRTCDIMARVRSGDCDQARPQRNRNSTANRHGHAGHLRAIPLRSFTQNRAITPLAELHLGSGSPAAELQD